MILPFPSRNTCWRKGWPGWTCRPQGRPTTGCLLSSLTSTPRRLPLRRPEKPSPDSGSVEGGSAAGREKREDLWVNKTWTTLFKKKKTTHTEKYVPSFFLPPIFFTHYFILFFKVPSHCIFIGENLIYPVRITWVTEQRARKMTCTGHWQVHGRAGPRMKAICLLA